jgi:hypothetical protein
MDLHNHFDFSNSKSGRPSAARIITAWKKAGRPHRFSVAYGETEAEFEHVGGRWHDSGNGCRGVDRNAVLKALAQCADNGAPATEEPAPVPQGDDIVRWSTKTRAGHALDVFYNRTTNLLVIDINHKERAGGNEIVRRTLDEAALLKHCARLPKWEDA